MKAYRISKKLMGSSFEFLLHHDNDLEAEKILDAGISEVERLEALLSEFRENTITTSLNRNAGLDYVYTGSEVFELIARCLHLSELTQGAFDITMGPLKKLYTFKNSDFVFPENDQIAETLNAIGYTKVEMNKSTTSVKLQKQKMFLSFAAVGKGYAADKVKDVWLKMGVKSGVISASGDMSTIGLNSKGEPWNIGIADPDNPDSSLFFIPIVNASVATSGDYIQYFTSNGKRYSHNINPKTGLPVEGLKSVTVISPAAELSDALATAVNIMGVDNGMHLIDQLPDTHCIIIDSNNKRHFSKNIQIQNEN